MPQLAPLSPDEIALLEAKNGLRQFDRVVQIIGDATGPTAARFRLRPSTLQELNRIAVEGLEAAAGSWRLCEIGISNSLHTPPPPEDVAMHIDEMCEYVNDRWDSASPVHLGAYLLWRLNWIHPFTDGNGRTSRAISFLVLCVRLGYRLPGAKAIPERLAENKPPYYHALDLADASVKSGALDVSAMEALLSKLLAAQLIDVHQDATGATT